MLARITVVCYFDPSCFETNAIKDAVVTKYVMVSGNYKCSWIFAQIVSQQRTCTSISKCFQNTLGNRPWINTDRLYCIIDGLEVSLVTRCS